MVLRTLDSDTGGLHFRPANEVEIQQFRDVVTRQQRQHASPNE